MPLERWLYAIGIPQVGVTVARDIAREHERLSSLKDSEVLKNVIANDLKKGIEREILPIKAEPAKAVLGFFASPAGEKFLGKMAELGIDPERSADATAKREGPLSGMTFVLTGALSKPRSEYAGIIENAGGVVQSSVTSKTMYLVAGENTGATKTEKARKFGTRVIGEPDLLALLSGERGPQ